MKERRLTKGKKKERCVLNSGEFVVQRLSSTVSGKAQKYSRVGPRVFVSFPYEEMTINNITSACEKHFLSVTDGGLVCDVVAGDQGSSCRMLDQLPDTKVIRVRFIESELETIQDTSGSPSKRIKNTLNSFCGSPSNADTMDEPKKHYQKCLSISEMLKLEKKIEVTTTTVELFTFDFQSMSWSKQSERVEFSMSKKLFASGGGMQGYITAPTIRKQDLSYKEILAFYFENN